MTHQHELELDIERIEKVLNGSRTQKTVTGKPSSIYKLLEKVLVSKKEKLAELEEKEKWMEGKEKVVIRLGRTGQKLHPAIVETYEQNGLTRYRETTVLCSCPNTQNRLNSTGYKIFKLDHSHATCRK